MTPQPYTVELDPETKTTLNIYLFKDIKNIEVIKKNITEGIWRCAVIKPSLILDPFQIAVAANKAVVSQKMNTMVTRTVFAEILFNLSLTKNISQSLSKFGIENCKDLLVCFLKTEENDDSEEILPKIEGELCSMTDLKDCTCIKDIKSAYKLNNLQSNDGLLDVVVSRIVTKSFVQH